MAVISPFWQHPGTLNGRILPECTDAQGAVSLYYYGGAYYYSYVSYAYVSGYSYDYTTETDHVFCLGADICESPSYRFSTDDTTHVEQTIADLTDIDVVYFCWRLRTSENMPQPRTLTGTSVEFKTGMGAYGDGAPGIVLPKAFTSGFLSTDEDQILTVSGTTSNDGTYRIAGVPWDTYGVGTSLSGRVAAVPDTDRWIGPGDADPAPDPPPNPTQLVRLYKNGQVAVLEDSTITPEVASGVTLTMLGARWVAKAYIDDELRTELRETRAGRSWQRNYMAAHVAKLTGVHALKFELSLETFSS